MAEDNGDNKKSTGIGELFVEFGVKGLPNMLKGLNAVSASFLLGKNAASQFAQTLTKPIKEAGAGAVEIGKLSNSLDTSYKNVAKLQNYLKSKNVSEGLVNDLGNIQTTVRDVLSGFTELPGSFANAFAKTGHTLSDYSEDFTDILRLVKDIQNADLSRSDRNQIFDFFGISRDWGYLFDRGDFNLDDALALSDDVIEKNIEAAENLQKFNIALKNLTDLLIAKFLPSFTNFVNWFEQKTKLFINNGDLDNFINGVETTQKNIEQTKKEITGAVNKAKEQKASGLFVPLAAAGYYLESKQKKEQLPGINKQSLIGRPEIFNSKKQSFYSGILPLSTNGASTGGAAPIAPDFMTTPEALAPSNISSMMDNNISITNQNNITGSNAQAIADKIAAINENDINYTQYQISNLPGI